MRHDSIPACITIIIRTGAFHFDPALLEFDEKEAHELLATLPRHDESPPQRQSGTCAALLAGNHVAAGSPYSYSSSDSMSDSPPPSRGGRSVKKHKERMVVHNAVERRYRNSINERIVELDGIVPLIDGQAKRVRVSAAMRGAHALQQTNKSSVLVRAIEYIQHLKRQNQELEEEVRALREAAGAAPRAPPPPHPPPTHPPPTQLLVPGQLVCTARRRDGSDAAPAADPAAQHRQAQVWLRAAVSRGEQVDHAVLDCRARHAAVHRHAAARAGRQAPGPAG